MNFKKLNVNCPINSTGYGITSQNIVKSLYKKGIDLSLFPIGSNLEVNTKEDHELISSLVQKSDSFDYNAPCLKIWHQFDLASKIGNGHYYTFPFFEVDKITAREQHHLNYSDFIFVASNWAKKVLQNNSVNKPIYVAPLGVDLSIFHTKPKIKIQKDNYVFFHIGKWEIRKAQDFLIKAFSLAFKPTDNVELRLLPHNPFLKEEELKQWYSLVQQSPLVSKIKIYERLPTQYHVADFIDNTDCGVFLSRAEGWNNEIIESMAMNKPIIATDYSAHTEYLTDKNAFKVGVDHTESANDGKWFNGFGNWAKLDQKQLDQTIDYMRYVYNNDIRNNLEGVMTANYYTWDNTVDSILKHINSNNSYYANTKAKSKRRR
jgi:glycosyltransferase involved in cell wall biosynthesis